MSKLAYRPDIDGLRAIAVLAVVVHHAELGLRGGYVGVDVFFVISGYLITAIIAGEMAAGVFSFPSFWSRRIRRILPAAAAVTLASYVFGYWVLSSSDLVLLGESGFATACMVANVFFWKSGNYFAESSSMQPCVVHFWRTRRTLGMSHHMALNRRAR